MSMAPTTAAIAPAQWLPLAIGAAAAVVWAIVAMRMRAKPPAQDLPPDEPQAPTRKQPPARTGPMMVIGFALAGAVWIVAGRPSLALGVLAAWYALTVILRARRRSRELAMQEAYALAAISTAGRALRAGIPLAGAIDILAKEAQGDAGAAFREIIQREALGEELPSAVRRVLLASQLASLRAFGLALLVQLTAGGNIADTSERLARSMIERNRVRRRARTIVAYGRAAAFLLGLLPLAVIPVLSLNIDGYAQLLFDRPIGNMLLALSAMLIATGLIVVQRMCRIDETPEWRPA
jgi:tight adherence protein B